MSLSIIVFLIVVVSLACGALVEPVLGILGYMTIYMIGPEIKWWHAPLNHFGLRYSLTFAVLIAISILFNRHKIRYKKLFVRQEVLALLLLLLMWILALTGVETVGRYAYNDHPALKIAKVMIFCLMMTHVITRPKDVNKIMWLFVFCSLILGLQAYNVPQRAFIGGRLDGRVGGIDFLDSNALAAFMVSLTVLTGTVLMRTSLPGKLLCAVTAAFSMNTIVLCKSRGAVLALIGSGIAFIFGSPRHLRTRIIIALLAASVGLLYVSDTEFLERMGRITSQAGSAIEKGVTSDGSANMRLKAWRGGLMMFKDHPLGVGPGNFNQYIGRYSPDVSGLSPHSTYIQSIAELGIPGLVLLLALFVNGEMTVLKVLKKTYQLPEPDRTILQWSSLGLGAVLAGWATCGITAHLLYQEGFWWFLLLPVCLQRASENAHEDHLLALSVSSVVKAESSAAD